MDGHTDKRTDGWTDGRRVEWVGFGLASRRAEGEKLLSRRIYFSIPLIIYARNRIHTHMGIYWIFILYSNARRRTANVSASAAGAEAEAGAGVGVESAASPGRRTVKWGSPL